MNFTIELEEVVFCTTGECCEGAAAVAVTGEPALDEAADLFCVAWEWPDGRVESGNPLRRDMAEYYAAAGNQLDNGVRYWVESFRG